MACCQYINSLTAVLIVKPSPQPFLGHHPIPVTIILIASINHCDLVFLLGRMKERTNKVITILGIRTYHIIQKNRLILFNTLKKSIFNEVLPCVPPSTYLLTVITHLSNAKGTATKIIRSDGMDLKATDCWMMILES